jgi:tetratricopeptide (TPR) repeat protein
MKNLIVTLIILMAAPLAFAQNYGDTPEIEEACKQNLSLYREFRNQKLYDDAIKPYREALRICPASAKTLYTDGVVFYKHFIDNAKDEAVKQAYIDTLLSLYDQRIVHYGEEGFVLGMKGVDMLKYRPDDAKAAEAVLRRSVELQKNQTDAVVLSNFYQSIFKLYQAGEADRSDLMTEFMPVLEYIEYNIQNLDDSVKADRYLKARENLFTFFLKVADDCDKIVEILSNKLNQDKNNIEQNIKVLQVLNAADCTESDFYQEVAMRVYQHNPTHDAAYSIGVKKLKNKEYSEAKKFFDEAIKLCTGCTKFETYNLRAGQVAIVLGDYNGARGYANKILSFSPKSAEAMILQGDAIAAAAPKCDGGKLGAAAIYLLAVDYYIKARNMGGSAASKANAKISTYSQYFPTGEDIFFNTLKEGDAYLVPCFNENTTIRKVQ